MQKGQRIFKNCKKCRGTGSLWKGPNYEYPHSPPAPETTPPTSYTEVECSDCEGLGIVPWGWVRDQDEDTMPGEEA